MIELKYENNVDTGNISNNIQYACLTGLGGGLSVTPRRDARR